MRISDKIKENKIFFITFILITITSLYYLIGKDFLQLIDNYYFPLYVINYDCGYCSRLLVGAVFSLFFKDTLDVDILANVLIVVYALMCFFFSLFVNNHLKKTNFEGVGIYAVFMVISPVFLSFLRFLGIVDVFWLFFVMGALWAVNKKGWRWLVPLFCIIGLAIHELFATTYLPVIAIAVLYQFIKKPDVPNFIFIAVCAIIVGATAIYFLFIGDNTMKMTSDEMSQFARERLAANGSNFDDFYLRSVFFWETEHVENYEGFLGYLQYGLNISSMHNKSYVKEIIFFVLSNLLTSIPFIYLIVKSTKKETSPAKKFIYFCCLMPIPLSIAHLFLSTDTDRFSIHWLMAILFILLFFIKEKEESFYETYDEAKKNLSENKIALAFFGIAVARIVLSGVRF